ncbi:unnamed protein product [Timema podura]|uniref:Uncharacterized protein n=1 Tax=Timema podura TaxID=61482 RepID=A0ABN7PCR3_TIMPD|nr:unnamed protein product [Timema podura]
MLRGRLRTNDLRLLPERWHKAKFVDSKISCRFPRRFASHWLAVSESDVQEVHFAEQDLSTRKPEKRVAWEAEAVKTLTVKRTKRPEIGSSQLAA